MLWYKSWLETRWRFLIGLALLILLRRRHRARLSARGQSCCRCVPSIDAGGELGRRIREDRDAVARATAATSGRSGSART